MSTHSCLNILIDPNSFNDDKLKKKAYSELIVILKNKSWNDDTKFLSLLQTIHIDLNHFKNENFKQIILKALGFLTCHELPSECLCNVQNVISDLIHIIENCPDKATCNLAIWVIATQQNIFQKFAQSQHIKSILLALNGLFYPNPRFYSSTIENQLLIALTKLLNQIPEIMTNLATLWLPLVYIHLLSETPTY